MKRIGIIGASLAAAVVMSAIGAGSAVAACGDPVPGVDVSLEQIPGAGGILLVRAAVIKEVKTNTMLLTETGKYTQSKGKQKPENCAGGVAKEDVLESSWLGAAYEQTGLALTYTRTNEEKIEVNTVVGSEPEYGRCMKKAKVEGAGYSNAGCTTAIGSKAKYEWLPGPGPKNKAVTVGGASFLETAIGKQKLACTGEKSGVVVADPHTGGASFTFTGCNASGLSFQSVGAAEGEAVWNKLECTLAVTKVGTKPPLNNKVGEVCKPAA
jgi:hypothetical protein